MIPVGAMKDGLIVEAKSSVASRKRFKALTEYVHQKLKTAGQEILSGNIAVNPYKQGNRTDAITALITQSADLTGRQPVMDTGVSDP